MREGRQTSSPPGAPPHPLARVASSGNTRTAGVMPSPLRTDPVLRDDGADVRAGGMAIAVNPVLEGRVGGPATSGTLIELHPHRLRGRSCQATPSWSVARQGAATLQPGAGAEADRSCNRRQVCAIVLQRISSQFSKTTHRAEQGWTPNSLLRRLHGAALSSKQTLALMEVLLQLRQG